MDEEAETGDTKKRGVLAKVFGGCFPWLASSEELEVDAQEAAKFEGKPDSIVIVKIEKCVHLPAMINNESSNPYVEIKSRAKRKKTNVIKETLDPIFDAKFDMEHSRDDEVRDLQLTVYHSKFGGGKQFLGQHYVDLKNTKLGDKIQMREFSLKMEGKSKLNHER